MNLSHYKAVIFDIDGTAITNGRWSHPSQKLIQVCKSAQEKSILLAAATGRNYKFCQYLLEELVINSPSIVAAGTQIIDPKTGVEVWSKQLDPDSVRNAFEVLMPLKCQILIDDDTPEEALNVTQLKVGSYRLLDVQDIPNDQVDSVVAALKSNLNLSVAKVVSHSPGNHCLHITHKAATKEFAVQVWLKLHNLNANQVIGVGDGSNDLELFKSVGFKVAMGNATSELKAASDLVIDSVENDGLAQFISQMLI